MQVLKGVSGFEVWLYVYAIVTTPCIMIILVLYNIIKDYDMKSGVLCLRLET